jgi:trehalose 6-phosphate synthase
VTGLEPILRACGGVWLGHASGDADRETADAEGVLRVPPHDPQYTLKRVWLSEKEEDGYYYGFSNEGLWPLCHIAHTRPIFEAEDWRQYRAVNEKFARALLHEMEGTTEPCVLIQDYHFALLPRLVKALRPDARVAIFWHIPWPNPEAFDICPWKDDILDGMLGADLIGFHIQFHCNNFLETIDRSLESQVDWERFAVRRSNRVTLVKPFPISIAFPAAPSPRPAPTQEELLLDLGVKGTELGVGVDRIDYTKGIVERFRGIERLLERYPEHLGRFCFVELAAPSRTLIQRYHDLIADVEAECQRINARFQDKQWRPIVLLKRIHSHEQIEPFYRAARLCLVTSLHDGMNLVAKEFVAARDDEAGALILSRFTGAARELQDALLVNPYHVDELADAIHDALAMSPSEQRRRMAGMRRVVREHNVYRWAARLIEDLAKIPTSAPAAASNGRR